MNVRIFFGYAFMVVGGLMALAAGGCVLVFLNEVSGSEDLYFILMFGGPPLLFGLGLFWIGHWLRRRGRAARPANPADIARVFGEEETKAPPAREE